MKRTTALSPPLPMSPPDHPRYADVLISDHHDAQASVHDANVIPALLNELPLDTHFVLDDNHYQLADLHDQCDLHGWALVASHWIPTPPTDPGKPVCAVFHAQRHAAPGAGPGRVPSLIAVPVDNSRRPATLA